MRASSRPIDRALTRVASLARAGWWRVPARVRAPIKERFSRQLADARVVATAPRRFELGQQLFAEGREGDAAEAFMAAAEHGEVLPFLSRRMLEPAVRDVLAEEANVTRMCRVAGADPESAAKQFFVGAFLIDQGRSDEGREAMARAFEMVYGQGDASPLDPSHPPHGPDFLVLGPPKTGTTTLYDMLAAHPNVVRTFRKELFFFGLRHDRPLTDYDSYFPALRSGFLTGEACPNNLRLPEAAQAVAERYPWVKTVVMRRDPVERTYSHYQMERRGPRTTRTLREAIEVELEELGDTPPLDFSDLPSFDRERPLANPLLLGSCILPYLKLWVDAVDPERVLVIESRRLLRDRQATLDVVHDFLGLPSSRAEEVGDRNVHPYEPISDSMERRLRAWFAPHEAALDEFLAGHPNVVGSAP